MDLLPQVPDAVQEIASTLRSNNFQCYLVGGSIRDLVRGDEPKDWDLATDATPQQVQPLFRKTIPTGIRFGTITIMIHGEGYEITTFRAEAGYSDGRRPDVVEFAASIEDDLSRRDFTFNAMALDLQSGTIVDPWGGQKDLEDGIVRAVADARERLGEDGLRILRAFRFRRLGQLEPSLREAIVENHAMLDRIARERILMEVERILPTPLGPELILEMVECQVLEHVLKVFGEMTPDQLQLGADRLGRLDSPSFPMALAALVSPKAAIPSELHSWGRELKMSARDIDEFVALISWHIEVPPLAESDTADLRWFRYQRRKYLEKLLPFSVAVHNNDAVRQARDRILQTRIPPEIPLVGGKEIMDHFSIRSGPRVGQVKNFLTEVQVRENISDPAEMQRRLTEVDLTRFS